MKRNILFIQGGGKAGYKTDAKLAASLQQTLGKTHNVHYPQMKTDEALQDFGWSKQIGKEISAIKSEVILVRHSLGASMLIKYLSENEIRKKISGIFLISTPYWSGEENWVQGLKLHKDFEEKLPQNVPIFFYHCKDDEEIPIEHLDIYRQKLSSATFHEIRSGGHQINDDLTIVAKDIKQL
jgi:serine hydrolase